MPKDNLPNLARLIYEAYPDSDLLPIDPQRDCRSLDDLLERVTTQDLGDSLLEFLVTEIVEGGEGTLEGAIRVLTRARKDVDAVLQALFRARFTLPLSPSRPRPGLTPCSSRKMLATPRLLRHDRSRPDHRMGAAYPKESEGWLTSPAS